MPEAVLTVEDVAVLLRVSRHTVYRLAQRGELPGRKIGRIWRFPRFAVERYLAGEDQFIESAAGDSVGANDQGAVGAPSGKASTVHRVGSPERE